MTPAEQAFIEKWQDGLTPALWKGDVYRVYWARVYNAPDFLQYEMAVELLELDKVLKSYNNMSVRLAKQIVKAFRAHGVGQVA